MQLIANAPENTSRYMKTRKHTQTQLNKKITCNYTHPQANTRNNGKICATQIPSNTNNHVQSHAYTSEQPKTKQKREDYLNHTKNTLKYIKTDASTGIHTQAHLPKRKHF